jgi:hypothetical protein
MGQSSEETAMPSFTQHPRSVGETYGEHMGTAFSFGFAMIWAGLACVIHGLAPFAFQRTGSDCIRRLHERMSRRGHAAPASAAAAR